MLGHVSQAYKLAKSENEPSPTRFESIISKLLQKIINNTPLYQLNNKVCSLCKICEVRPTLMHTKNLYENGPNPFFSGFFNLMGTRMVQIRMAKSV